MRRVQLTWVSTEIARTNSQPPRRPRKPWRPLLGLSSALGCIFLYEMCDTNKKKFDLILIVVLSERLKQYTVYTQTRVTPCTDIVKSFAIPQLFSVDTLGLRVRDVRLCIYTYGALLLLFQHSGQQLSMPLNHTGKCLCEVSRRQTAYLPIFFF